MHAPVSASPAIAAASPTPILDRLQPMPAAPKRWKSGLIGALLGVLLGLFLGFGSDLLKISSPAVVRRGFSQVAFPIAMLLILILQYVVVIVHEFGHFVFGTMAGLKLNFLRIGPFQISQSWKISRHRRTGTGAAGLASLIPPEGPLPLSHLILYLLGGVSANLITAGAVMLVDKWKPLPAPFGIFVFISLLVAFVNVLPFRYRSMVSDGGRIWMLLFKREQAERWLAIMRLGASLAHDTRPEDLDSNALTVATRLQDKSPDTVAAHGLAYMAAYHRHLDDEAARALEVCLSHANLAAPASRQSLSATAGVFLARRRGDVVTARQWLESLPKKTQIPGLHEQVEAAILEAERNAAAALEKIDQAFHLTSSMPEDVDRRVRLASLQRWKGELSARAASAT